MRSERWSAGVPAGPWRSRSRCRAPGVLGFTDDTVATVLYVVIGAGGLGATLLTRSESDLMPASLRNSPLTEPQPSIRSGASAAAGHFGVDDDPAVVAAMARHQWLH